MQQYAESGDQEVLGELFNEYVPLVYGICLKYLKNRAESQDAVMDIYEHISEKLKSKEVAHFKSWLYMVSKNHCLMILRKNNPEVNTSLIMESPDVVHLREEKLDLEKDLKALEQCIAALKQEQKICVTQFFLEKKSYHEVEASTQLGLKKVKSAIQNGKRNLKICLEENNVKR